MTMKTKPLNVDTNEFTPHMSKRVQNAFEQAIATIQDLEDEGSIPDVFRFTVYESDADLHLLRLEDGETATAAEQRLIVEHVANSLRARGHKVSIVTMRARNYLNWLEEEGYENNATRRAQWVSELSGVPEPLPPVSSQQPQELPLVDAVDDRGSPTTP